MMKKKLSDQDFLNMSEDEQMKAMESGIAPADMERSQEAQAALDAPEGVMPKVAKDLGYKDLQDLRDSRQREKKYGWLKGAAEGLGDMAAGAMKTNVPNVRFQAPTIQAPRDVMSGLRQEVLANLARRR